MSVYEDRVLTCPHCGHAEARQVAVSLSGDRIAHERQEILDDTFQRFTCTACQRPFRADGPLIYIDFDEKLWIAVFPAPWEAAWWDHEDEPRGVFERYMIENCPPLVREWAPGFAVRAVFGLDRLREKLVAHAAGIDDRVLEAFKLDLLRGMGTHELSPRARPTLREVTADTAVFHVPRPDPDEPAELAPARLAEVRVARAELDRIAAARDGAWASTIAAVSEGPYVDLGRLFAPRPADEATA